MHLFLTSVLPFLAHNHASAAAFLTCRHHNFHSSIIPEFLSDEERVQSFSEARQQIQIKADKGKQYKNLYNLFIQTPLIQFSPSLIVSQEDCAESILKPLLETKYFTRSLQHCTVGDDVPLNNDLLQGLSKVQSLTEVDLGWSDVKNEHLEIIINSFSSLETLTIENAGYLRTVDPNSAINIDLTKAISISSPPPPATKTLRSLIMREMNPLFAARFVPLFPNLQKLELGAQRTCQELDLLPLTSSLPLLTDLFLDGFNLEKAESIKNLVHLTSLEFRKCRMFYALRFLTQENSLPQLTTLRVDICGFSPSSSFSSLSHAPNLHVLGMNSHNFNNDCLQYLENMVHLRKLDLSCSAIVGDSRSLKTLMQNLFQLEELNLSGTFVGNQGAIAGALYSTHSRLRVLSLAECNLVDDDLNGIGALKNTLGELDLAKNTNLTREGLMSCKDLVKLKSLKLNDNKNIDDLSPLKDCLNLEELDVSNCDGLIHDSFKVFSEEPNSFPNLRILDLSFCDKLTGKIFKLLAKNNYLVHQLKELNVVGMCKISSAAARNNISQLKGLRQLHGLFSYFSKNVFKREVMRNLKNLDTIEYY